MVNPRLGTREPMTITVELGPEEETKLLERAAQSGQNVTAYVRNLIARDIQGVDEALAPFRRQVEESGLSDAELQVFFEAGISRGSPFQDGRNTRRSRWDADREGYAAGKRGRSLFVFRDRNPDANSIASHSSVRHYDGKVVPGEDRMGRKHFWFVVTPIEQAEEGTDRWAIEHDYVSMTPLRLDLTNEAELADAGNVH
jgi:hypothetical protein